MKKVIKFDERNPIHRHFKAYQERLIKFSDINHTEISNERARIVLGRFMRLTSMEQTQALIAMEELQLIKRNGKRMIEILPV